MAYNISRVGLGLKLVGDNGLSYYFSNYSVTANPDPLYPSTSPTIAIRSATGALTVALPDIGTVGGVAKQATVAGVLDQIAQLGVVVTAGVQTATSAGAVAAGASLVSILNNGSADGTVLGATLPAGGTITFPTTVGQVYGAIAYDATGTTFIIQTNR